MTSRRNFLKGLVATTATVATGITLANTGKQIPLKPVTSDIKPIETAYGSLTVYTAKVGQGLSAFLGEKVKELALSGKKVLFIEPEFIRNPIYRHRHVDYHNTNLITDINMLITINKYDAVVIDNFGLMITNTIPYDDDHFLQAARSRRFLVKNLRSRGIESHIGVTSQRSLHNDEMHNMIPNQMAYSADSIYRVNRTGIIETLKSRYPHGST